MQMYQAFLVPAGFALFVAMVGVVSVVMSRRRIAARMHREARPERNAAAYQ
ncbi:MAG: hypothetical protein ACREQH_15615 [Candidatus Binatus sp.]